jgi:hypothetical protein
MKQQRTLFKNSKSKYKNVKPTVYGGGEDPILAYPMVSLSG